MLNKLSKLCVGFLFVFWSSISLADGPYIELKLGANAPSNLKDLTQVGNFSLDFSNGFTGALSLGFATDHMRFEAELSVTDANFTSMNDVQAAIIDRQIDGGLVTAMVNGYYDLTDDFIITPYVGIGVGYASTNLSTISNSKRPAFQGITGFKYKVKDNFWVGGEYRYFRTGTEGELDSFKSSSFMTTFEVGF
ncbi:MAG: outer membrane protein [Sphingomonadales bacterium]|jgi:opacity protein-like surface antigen